MKRIITAAICLLTAAALISCGKASPNDNETDRPSGTSSEITETNAPAAGTDAPETQPPEDDDASPASDFQYEVSGKGDSVYITKYTGKDENVVIPSEIDGLPVTALAGIEYDDRYDGAFENSGVRTVEIPDTVTLIRWEAFGDCKELTGVKVPPSVTRIEGNAFINCAKLEKIDLSGTKIMFVETNTFSGCTSLCEVKLPSTLTSIEAGAFNDCTSLLEMRLPENVDEIENGAFVNCTSLKTITIPAGLIFLASDYRDFQFGDLTSIEKIIFEEGREEIDGYAFFGIRSDVEIVIPASVKKFSPDAFFVYGSAKYVFLGDCPEVADSAEFYGDAAIYYAPDTKGWDNCVWRGSYTVEPLDKEVRRHGENSEFKYDISEDGDAVYLTKYIGTGEDVVIPSEIDGIPVYSLQGVVDEYDLTVEGVFENCDIKTVTIPEGVAVIGMSAFRNCTELTSVSIPRSIEKLSIRAFENCAKLEEIDLSETKITVVPSYAFKGCSYLEKAELPACVSRIDLQAFMECIGLSEITLPENLVRIKSEAFQKCLSLSEIRLPENLVYVGKCAFAYCDSLKTVTVSAEDASYYEIFVFTNIPSLEKIIIEEGCERLDGDYFFDITSDPEIVIAKSVKVFAPYFFHISEKAKFVFLGDFPELADDQEYFSLGDELDLTICYDPTAKGWDDCVWGDIYTLEPIS